MPCRSRTRRSISQPSMPGRVTSSITRSGGSSSSAARPSSAVAASRTTHAVELEIDADELAQPGVVVHDEHDGVATGREPARCAG